MIRLPRGELGKISVPRTVAREAAKVARNHYRRSAEKNWAKDFVDDLAYPVWLPPVDWWLPKQDLARLGFTLADPGGHVERMPSLLSTTGVDPHTDNMVGTGLVWVLHNDGLRFVQGRNQHVTAAGSWFLFDDYRPHSVRPSKTSTAYVCVVVSVQSVGRTAAG